MRQGRIKQSTHSQQMHCRTFSNCTRGSDASKVWNAAECKCALEALLKGVLPKGPTEQPKHLNLNKTRENHRNTLKNFILRGLNKHFSWFRCGGKGKHLNLALRQNQAVNPLTTNALQDFRTGKKLKKSLQHIEKLSVVRFQQEIPLVQMRRQREASEPCIKAESSSQPTHNKCIAGLSQTGLEGNRLQMRPGGASGWGTPERANRTAQASEPERNSKKSLQHIEKLSIARLQQTHPLVQMRRQREVSAPCGH